MKKILQSLAVPITVLSLMMFSVTFAQTTSDVSMVDDSFSPSTITVNMGDTVTWTNNGSNEHTITADDGSFDSGLLSPGESYSRIFDNAGMVAYHCTPHGATGGVGMSGTIVVAQADTGDNDDDEATSTEPMISDIAATSSDDGTSVTITWMTDTLANSQVNYGTTESYGSSTTLDESLVTDHSVTITGLTPNTTYHYQVMSGSGTTVSSDQIVVTANPGDTDNGTSTEPMISDIEASSSDDGTSVTVTWVTDQAANSQVSYGTTSDYTASTTLDTNLVGDHSVTITGLTPNTTYHYQVMSDNGSGVVVSSADQTVMTAVGDDDSDNGNDDSDDGTNGDDDDDDVTDSLAAQLERVADQLERLISLLREMIEQRS